MVNGGLRAKPVELWHFGETNAKTDPFLPQLCTSSSSLLRDSVAQGTGNRHDRAAHVGACYRQGPRWVCFGGVAPLTSNVAAASSWCCWSRWR
jgi:hypothetical protein